MKHLFLILGIFFSLNLSAQRDSLNYHFAVDTDTITYITKNEDTIVTYTAAINGDTLKSIFFADLVLDSILTKKAADIEAIGQLMEAYYREYQRQNTILWNLKKEFARLEDINDQIYAP